MSCDVPQGSILSPLLWNMEYDWALQGPCSPGLGVICVCEQIRPLVPSRIMAGRAIRIYHTVSTEAT